MQSGHTPTICCSAWGMCCKETSQKQQNAFFALGADTS